MGSNVNLRKDFLVRFFTARGRTLARKSAMVLRNYHQDLALDLHKTWEVALGPRYSGTVAEAKKIVVNFDKSFLGDNAKHQQAHRDRVAAKEKALLEKKKQEEKEKQEREEEEKRKRDREKAEFDDLMERRQRVFNENMRQMHEVIDLTQKGVMKTVKSIQCNHQSTNSCRRGTALHPMPVRRLWWDLVASG
eukprot:PhM_4_TR2093/c1_g1_i7/m.20532